VFAATAGAKQFDGANRNCSSEPLRPQIEQLHITPQ
jgi:hypothetical protein